MGISDYTADVPHHSLFKALLTYRSTRHKTPESHPCNQYIPIWSF